VTSRSPAPLAQWYAAGAGAIAGLLYTMSPTTLWFLLLLPVLFIWSRRDLGPRERRWVLGLLGVAIAARLVVLAAFFLSVDHAKQPYGILIGDEWFIQARALRMLQVALGYELVPGDYSGVFGDYGRSGVLYLLAGWQFLVGRAPYGAHLLNVAMWLIGTIAFHRTARRAFGPLPALGGFAVLLFMPTLFVWSISALKEPAYFFLTAMTLVGAMAMVRERRAGARLGAVLLVAGAVAAIATLRTFGLVVAVGGLVIAAVMWLATRRVWLAFAVVLTLMAGAAWALRQPPIEARLMLAFRTAAITHLGNVITRGHGYRLLDPYFYTRMDNSVSYMVPADAGRFAMRAAVSFITVPLPWEIASRSALVLLPQQLAWYILVVLGGIGVVAGWRRDAVFTSVLLGNALLAAAIVALYNGNVGTLVRMRDLVVPVIVWLSAIGGCAVVDAAARRMPERSRHANS
jgi:hypothetical protein